MLKENCVSHANEHVHVGSIEYSLCASVDHIYTTKKTSKKYDSNEKKCCSMSLPISSQLAINHSKEHKKSSCFLSHNHSCRAGDQYCKHEVIENFEMQERVSEKYTKEMEENASNHVSNGTWKEGTDQLKKTLGSYN